MKILIAEDHSLFREALMGLLQNLEPEAEILESERYGRTFELVEQTPDLDYIVLDLDLPDSNWERGLKNLTEKINGTKIIVVSASDDSITMRRAGEYGIVGYIPKTLDSKILAGALKIILAGGTYMPIKAIGSLGEGGKSEGGTPEGLTKRQNEVLHLLAQGKSNKQIAYEIGVSEATVKLHINALLRVLGATNRTQAVITAQKIGFLK